MAFQVGPFQPSFQQLGAVQVAVAGASNWRLSNWRKWHQEEEEEKDIEPALEPIETGIVVAPQDGSPQVSAVISPAVAAIDPAEMHQIYRDEFLSAEQIQRKVLRRRAAILLLLN